MLLRKSLLSLLSLSVLGASVHPQDSQPAKESQPAGVPIGVLLKGARLAAPGVAMPVAGGVYGMRTLGRARLIGRVDGQPVATAIERGLQWLAARQEPDGHWATVAARGADPAGAAAAGAGQAGHEVLVTALAALCFLGDGSTLAQGAHQAQVKRAVDWLLRAQDQGDGFIGPRVGPTAMHGHAAATLVLVEAFGLSAAPELQAPCQKAVAALLAAQVRDGSWPSDPRGGPPDASVLGWAVPALRAAQDFKLEVQPDALKSASHWLGRMTDPNTGVLAWTTPEADAPRRREKLPGTSSASLTAMGLLARYFLGQDPRSMPVMTAAADMTLRDLPGGLAPDFDPAFLYFGSAALFQAGANHWGQWHKRVATAVLAAQRQGADPLVAGSWDPAGPFAAQGGRAYATALLVLALECHYRYARIHGGR